MGYMDKLQEIADEDVEHLHKKGEEYGDTWMEDGGIGAFFVTSQKWKRLHRHAKRHGYDVFAAVHDDAESVLDDIGDLRRYLMLIEAHVLQQNTPEETALPIDSSSSTVICEIEPKPWAYTWIHTDKYEEWENDPGIELAVTEHFDTAKREARLAGCNVYTGFIRTGSRIQAKGQIVFRAKLHSLSFHTEVDPKFQP
jgi:hypothetical protein